MLTMAPFVPTIHNHGDVSVEWERTIGDDSALTATLAPNGSINVEWRDNAWTANVDMPMTEIVASESSVQAVCIIHLVTDRHFLVFG